MDTTSLSFVGQLSDATRRVLEVDARRRHYQRGDALFREDDDGSQVMLLWEGRVKVSVAAPSGREVILHVCEPGVILGEIAAVDGGTRSATVTALTAVDVLWLPQPEFLTFLDDHSDAAAALLKILVAKLRGATRKQLEFGTADALSRLCRTLLELADRYAVSVSGTRRFDLPITQQELAALSGLSREAVVKGFASLRSLEWIRTSGRAIELVDETAISLRADAR